MTDLPLPSEQIKKLEQKIHSEKVIALLLANAKARRGFWFAKQKTIQPHQRKNPMLTQDAIFTALSNIDLRRMECDNLFTEEILNRADYSLRIALMMMQGDLSNLPTLGE